MGSGVRMPIPNKAILFLAWCKTLLRSLPSSPPPHPPQKIEGTRSRSWDETGFRAMNLANIADRFTPKIPTAHGLLSYALEHGRRWFDWCSFHWLPWQLEPTIEVQKRSSGLPHVTASFEDPRLSVPKPLPCQHGFHDDYAASCPGQKTCNYSNVSEGPLQCTTNMAKQVHIATRDMWREAATTLQMWFHVNPGNETSTRKLHRVKQSETALTTAYENHTQ